MINQALRLLDDTVDLIKSKDEGKSNFSKQSLHKFEFILFLSLDIVRYELKTRQKLTDLTSDAISQLFAFQCFEYYYRDFPEIYDKCSELFYVLRNYNEKLRNYDLKGNVGIKDSNWIKFFEKQISNLFYGNPDLG
jgi:hypothetical protein